MQSPERRPLSPLHRVMVVLRHLRRSPLLAHLHHHHPHPQCRHQVRRFFRHIDQLHDYIRRHQLLPPTPGIRPFRYRFRNQQEDDDEDVFRFRRHDSEFRRVHQQQIREAVTRIRYCVRPLQQYLLFHQPNQLTRHHQSMSILNAFASHL